MSDDVRVCQVDVDLLYSDNGGKTFDRSLPLETFGSTEVCYHPGEQTTNYPYALPTEPPSGRAGSLYKVEVTVTDHAGNTTVAESARPFYIVESNNDSVRTLILWHPDRMPMDTDADPVDLGESLENLSAHESVQGRVVHLQNKTDLILLYEAWDDATNAAATACAPGRSTEDDACAVETEKSIDAANELLFGDKGIHDYIQNELLGTFTKVDYLIVVGGDHVVPFARIRDDTRVASEDNYTGDIDLTSYGTGVGRALEANYYLSDDPLATDGEIDADNLHRQRFLPTRAIGRLVEKPTQINASISTFISKAGVIDVSPEAPANRSDKILVSAYDFLLDAGAAIGRQWRTVLDTRVDSDLVRPSWTADELESALCSTDYGVVSLNGHANHYEVGNPSGNPYTIEGLPTHRLASCDLSGSMVYAVGCHSGLSVPDSDEASDPTLDIPEAMMGAGTIAYLGNTGYGWGLTVGIGYSERLVDLFTQELTRYDEIEIGAAVLEAKERYDREAISFTAYDEKVSMQWTLFGFPMARLKIASATDTPSPRPFEPPSRKAEELPYRERLGAVTVERRFVDTTVLDGVAVNPPQYLTRETRSFDFSAEGVYRLFDIKGEEIAQDDISSDNCLMPPPDREDPDASDTRGCYYTLNNVASGDLSTSATDRPFQPVFISDIGLSGTRFQGFLWMGGTYVEQSDWIPIFAELQSNIFGDFSQRGALPSNSKANGRGRIRHGSPLGEECIVHGRDRTSLALEAGELQDDDDGEWTIQRRYESIDLELFYYSSLADQARGCDVTGPRVVAAHAVSGSTIAWTVHPIQTGEIDDIWRVVVVWNDNSVDAQGRGRWQPVELELNASGDAFEGSLDVFGSQKLSYFVQAVDHRGNVSLILADDPDSEPTSGVTHKLPEIVEVEIAEGTADLGLAFGSTPASVAGLTPWDTTVHLTNFGPHGAAGVSVAIDVSGARDVAASGEGWVCTAEGTTRRCRRSQAAVGPAPSIHLSGTASHVGPIELSATVTAVSRDDHPGNETATASIGVIEPPWADLAIRYRLLELLDRGVVTLQIEVTNHGPQAVVPATVATQLPPGLVDLAWLCDAGPRSSCTSAGVGTMVDRARLARNDTLVYTLTARAAPGVRSVIETITTVTPPTEIHDPDSTSNRSAVTIDFAPYFADGFESEDTEAWAVVVGESP
ncbi:MAG: hypothetical protein AAGE94_11020 [Acidobacteriota bacterium]